MTNQKARPGSDLEQENKTAPFICAGLSLLAFFILACMFINLGSFNPIVRATVISNTGWEKTIGFVSLLLGMAWPWIGWKTNQDGKTYGTIWFLLLVIGAIMSYGPQNI